MWSYGAVMDTESEMYSDDWIKLFFKENAKVTPSNVRISSFPVFTKTEYLGLDYLDKSTCMTRMPWAP